jgi:hypothetical protein
MYSSNGNPGLIVLSAALLLLAGCATSPTANERARSGATAAALTSDDSTTGKLEVVVRDQNGRYLELATVSVWSDVGARTYRSTGKTNYNGRAAFNGVPYQVRVEIRYANSSYSEAFTLTPGGLSEMRVSLDIGEPEKPRQRGGLGAGLL